MKSFTCGLVATALMAGSALAQTSTPGTAGNPAASPGMAPMAAPATPGAVGNPGMAASPTTTGTGGTTAGTMGTAGRAMGITGDGRAAASGNDNQAVATTTANSGSPAHGRNSFTMGEARRRIAARGFTNVANLKKDSDGVWRGTAQQNGAATGVWLDYKGNIGQAAS